MIIREERNVVFMSSGKTKRVFEVEENETIDQCLERIKLEGYSPIKRIEKPIFREIKKGTAVEYEPCGRRISFEAQEIIS